MPRDPWGMGGGDVPSRHSNQSLARENVTMLDLPKYPVKTRELHNHHFDSTIWNDLAFRDDDIVIATYAKAGITWCSRSSVS